MSPDKKANIQIKNLALRIILGANQWERKKKQDIIINISMTYDCSAAVRTDDIKNTLDYKKIKREAIDIAEKSRFRLVETLASKILDAIMKKKLVLSASVQVDKPHALRFAESVSVTLHAERDE